MLSREDITRNLMLFPDMLEHMLEEGSKAKITKQDYERGQVEIAISASCPKKELEEIVTAALKNSHLVGTLSCQPAAPGYRPLAAGSA